MGEIVAVHLLYEEPFLVLIDCLLFAGHLSSLLLLLGLLLSLHILLPQQLLLEGQLLQLLIVLDYLLASELFLLFSSFLEEHLELLDLKHQHLSVLILFNVIERVDDVFQNLLQLDFGGIGLLLVVALSLDLVLGHL